MVEVHYVFFGVRGCGGRVAGDEGKAWLMSGVVGSVHGGGEGKWIVFCGGKVIGHGRMRKSVLCG